MGVCRRRESAFISLLIDLSSAHHCIYPYINSSNRLTVHDLALRNSLGNSLGKSTKVQLDGARWIINIGGLNRRESALLTHGIYLSSAHDCTYPFIDLIIRRTVRDLALKRNSLGKSSKVQDDGARWILNLGGLL